ncbi:conserved hypothetical protein [uncultured Eubacteriales bacterium]|uniref:Putative Se/S carrier protein-like domain-containing protein n=1 Tax=uncultured Eubacteriales bacterium TaxID=172733 RepID=A0A212K0T0_9FIRM|nr:conserved hypothetical protein [uncultured Eubacteriales bacterium]
MDYCILAFTSTHAAISAQALLTPVCPVQTMPVLRQVSAGCGIALRFSPGDLPAVRTVLASSPLTRSEYALYAVTGGGANLRAESI